MKRDKKLEAALETIGFRPADEIEEDDGEDTQEEHQAFESRQSNYV